MKKIISLTIIAAMVFVTMAACASQPSGSGSTEIHNNATPAASTDRMQERVEFEFYSGVGGVLEEGLVEVVDAYNASQDQYTCKIVSFSSYEEVFKGFQAASAAKQPPALVMGGFGADVKKHAADVTQFANEYPDFTWDDYIDAHVMQCMEGERMVGLPLWGGGYQMFYHKQKVAELGLDPAVIFADWDAVREMAMNVTEKDANGNVAFWGFSQLWHSPLLHTWAMANGGRILSADEKTATVNTSEWVEVWELIREMIHEDETMNLYHGGQGWEAWYKTLDDVLEGRALACIGSSGDLPYMDFNIVDVYMPPKMKGQPFYSEPIACNVAIIPSSAPIEQQRAAFDFYVFYSSPENGAKISISLGIVPVNKKSKSTPEYAEFLKEHPERLVLFQLNEQGQKPFLDDPTNGKIMSILYRAYDQILIEGIPAQKALDEANADIQRELDLL